MPLARSKPGPSLDDLVLNNRWPEAVAALDRLHPPDAAAALDQLPERHQRSLFKTLSPQRAAAILPFLPYFDQFVLLHARSRSEMVQIVDAMPADDRMRLLDELPEASWEQLVRELSTVQREFIRRCDAYPENSAARYVTPDFISVSPHMRVEEVMNEIRSRGRAKETVNLVYVLDAEGKLVDEVSLATLVMSKPTDLVTQINDSPLISLLETDSVEDVLFTFEKYDRLALPVVDKDHHMLGILTVDDVMDIAHQLATRDLQKMGGMEALDAPYFSVRLKEMLRKRGGWLALLFLGEMLTATAMSHFQDEMAAAIVLALFVPLIISSGGNSGSQATSLLIRSLALREIHLSDWWRVAGREVIMGVLLGAMLGMIGFVRIVAWHLLGLTSYGPHYMLVALTVWLSLIGVVAWGSISGSMLPFILRRFGFDPATSSAPLVATLVDVSGLIIYFTIARIVLHGVVL